MQQKTNSHGRAKGLESVKNTLHCMKVKKPQGPITTILYPLYTELQMQAMDTDLDGWISWMFFATRVTLTAEDSVFINISSWTLIQSTLAISSSIEKMFGVESRECFPHMLTRANPLTHMLSRANPQTHMLTHAIYFQVNGNADLIRGNVWKRNGT